MDFDYGLLAKYIIDKLAPEEMEQVMEWRNLSAENERVFSDLVRLRISRHYMKYTKPEHIESALTKINARIDRTKRRSIFVRTFKYVAAVLLLFSISYGGYEYFKPENYMKIVVKPGCGIKKVILADGTAVWLKESSVLKIPESFSSMKRDVSLSGSAFFDVVKSSVPFYVSTQYVNVGVYGTTFELHVDHSARKVEATLLKGKITLLDQDRKELLDVLPGEKVTYDYSENEYVTEKIDVNLCAAWRYEQIVFEDETLRTIADKLSRKFQVNIHIQQPGLADRKFRCVINKDESLTDVLNLLEYLAPIGYRIDGKEVFIWENVTKNVSPMEE